MSRVIAIAGGGLAGMAAALKLARGGHRVVLVETRGKLGGRATSFDDPRGGDTLDNCQHVVMGCCTNLLDLYQGLGVLGRIRWGDATHWANPPHSPDTMRPCILPAPAHFTIAFARSRLFDTAEKRCIAKAMWQMIRMGVGGRGKWSSKTFGDFLRAARQAPRVVSHFWEPVVVGACNLGCDQIAAPLAIKVFQDGFLGDKWSPSIGLPDVPLLDLYRSAAPIIEASGGEVRLGESVEGISFDGMRATGLVTARGAIDASAVISALPPDRLDATCSTALRKSDPRLQVLSEFTYSPILGVHLFFDQPVMEIPHLVLPGRPTHWLFGKGIDSLGRHHLHAVISAADSWMDLGESEIVSRVMEDVHWALPGARGLEPVAYRSVKERRATVALTPDANRIRPAAAADGVRGGVRNLFLAGDWCATGWPATMEGAVRSGYAAAHACAPESTTGPVADVPPAILSAMMGLGKD